MAAQYYVVPEKEDEIGVCPLCLAQLTSAQQIALKAELAELKAHADAAERKLSDVCAALEKQLGTILTAELRKHLDLLASMDPKEAYASAARARFVKEDPFKSILTGIARLTEEIVTQQSATLPAFQYPEPEQADAEIPSVATEVLIAVHNLERLKALVDWWAEHGQSFRDAWTALVQQKDDTGRYLARTIAGQIEVLKQAIDRAEPLDELAKSLSSAAEASGAWDSIQEQQNLREAIAEALEPLKELRLLVSAETAASIAGLSGRIKEILNRIHLRERLDYADASLEKKAVHVEGSFDPGMRIDAALVANTSWLRAILWAFVLALREQTIDGLKENPFPLAVMDDPQATFDPRNKRKWAEVLASSANADRSDKQGTQLIVTTHEQQFFKFLVNEQKLAGQQGLIAAVNKVNRVARRVRLVRAHPLDVTPNRCSHHARRRPLREKTRRRAQRP